VATEEGIVIRADGGSAIVKATKTDACKACTARGSCHVMGGGREMEISAFNPVGAEVDDHVLLSFDTSSLLKASFLLYIVPVFALLAGAVAGHYLTLSVGWDPSIGACVLGFLSLSLSAAFIKARGNAMGKKTAYQPKIIRILR